MNITYWTDLGQYFNQTRSGRRAIEKLNRVGDSLDHHRLQQQTFYRGCLSYLKQQNRTWTMMTDTVSVKSSFCVRMSRRSYNMLTSNAEDAPTGRVFASQ
jgi:hypothetical protein